MTVENPQPDDENKLTRRAFMAKGGAALMGSALAGEPATAQGLDQHEMLRREGDPENGPGAPDPQYLEFKNNLGHADNFKYQFRNSGQPLTQEYYDRSYQTGRALKSYRNQHGGFPPDQVISKRLNDTMRSIEAQKLQGSAIDEAIRRYVETLEQQPEYDRAELEFGRRFLCGYFDACQGF